MIYDDVVLKGDGVYSLKTTRTGEVEERRIANYINIINQEMNLDSKEYLATLEFQLVNSTKRSNLQVKVSDIASSQAILKLSAYGVDINDLNKTEMVKHLRNCREVAPYSYTHHTLGFKASDDGQLNFYHDNVIGFSQPSEYIGPFNIKPSGSEEAYMNMIEEEVLGHTPLELGLVLGASSAVIGLLGNQYSIENLFLHLVGDSSTGKTTVATLATSLWGSPTLASNGLLSSWNSTLNALQRRLCGNYGVTICLDEVSQYNGKDVTKVIYSLTEGIMRSRLDKDSHLREGGSWKTTILSTGERSLMDYGCQNTGLRVRLFELELNEWTRNAENSNQIKRIISQNYGFLGMRFVEYLLSLQREEIYQFFEEYEVYMMKLLPETPLKTRLASKLSVIMVTGSFLQEFGIPINLDEIEKLLLSQFSRIGVEADLGNKAYEKLLQYLSANRSKFIHQYKSRTMSNLADYNPSHFQGRIKFDHNDEIEEVAIVVEEFKKIMESLGFESYKLILKNWKAKGFLDCEQNKLQKRISINNIRTSYIVLKVSMVESCLREMLSNDC